MRVLFVNPHYPHDPLSLLLHPPLCYAYMSTALKAAGHDVVHADLPFEGNHAESVLPYLEDFRPDLVGVTSVAQSYCQALEIAGVVKDWNANVPVLFGGPHVTFIPEEVLDRHQTVDYVLLYDAEESMVNLADALEAGAHDLSLIPGLLYRSSGGNVRTRATAPYMDLDVYGPPDRSIFDMNKYLDYDYETVVMTARGCPSKCTFCSTTLIGRRYRWHSATRVCDELEQVANLGFSSIFFGDDTFGGNEKRTLELCEEMRRRDLRLNWTCNMRALDAKPEILDAMKAAGAYRVFIGYESIQQDALRLVKKGTSPEKLYNTAQLVKSHGLELHASFIVGAPGDTPDTLKATLDFIRVVNPTIATFNVMEPRPGTDVYANPEKYGLTIPDPYWYETSSWLNEPTCYNDNMSQAEIGYWVSKCFDEFCSDDFRSPRTLEALAEVEMEWKRAAEAYTADRKQRINQLRQVTTV